MRENDFKQFAPIQTAWVEVLNGSPENKVVAMSAAIWFARSDPSFAFEIVNRVIKSEESNILARNLGSFVQAKSSGALCFDFRDLEFENVAASQINSFIAPANELLASICDQIDLHTYSELDRLTIPLRTLRTNEQVLAMNPNDICEILGWCCQKMLGAFIYLQDLEVAEIYTKHVLWLLENVPHANLYFFTRIDPTRGIPSHARVLKKAVSHQRKRHGKFVAKYRPEFRRKKT